MQILNISGYKFIQLSNLKQLRDEFFATCHSLDLKGTLLISHEGINLSLSGAFEKIQKFIEYIKSNESFADIQFHQTFSKVQIFHRLKVKLKKEIITFKEGQINSNLMRAPHITPEHFKQWLDAKHDLTILDVRNNYEINYGTFDQSVNLKLHHFSEFKDSLENIRRDKPIVMFCTGGIRCEKAAQFLLSNGFKDVYQLDGGILGYFAKVGGAHYSGNCFVFDEREAVNSKLEPV